MSNEGVSAEMKLSINGQSGALKSRIIQNQKY